MLTGARRRQCRIDFTQGKMLKNIILFTIPGLIIAVVQLIFDNMGMIVIGRTGTVYQAAVGAGASVIGFGLGFLIHIANGGGLAAAIAVGKGDEEKQNKVIHTSMAFSFTFGPLVSLLGFLLAKPVLRAMSTPTDCFALTVLYVRIYFLCAPARLVYNFAMSISRGLGDSNKPLRYILTAGALKVGIILITVLLFKWHVVGIALSTVIAEYVAAIWGLSDLKKGYGKVGWSLRNTRFHGKEMLQILLLGVPTVLGGWSLSIASIVMQSKINLYSSVAVAGSSVAASVNNIVLLTSGAFTTTVGAFVGQNWGAKKYRRVKTGMLYIMGVTMLCVLFSLGLVLLFKEQVVRLFSKDPAAIDAAYIRLENDLLHGSFLQALANIYGMALSGMGYAIFPMLTNVFAVVINILWATVIYPLRPSLEFLYFVYPVTAIFTGIGDMLITHLIVHRFMRKKEKEKCDFAYGERTEEDNKDNLEE